MGNKPQSNIPERDLDTKVKDVCLYKRPLKNNLASCSSSSANSSTQARDLEIMSNLNIMHFLFIVLLENDREYILEFSTKGYNLEIFTQSKFNFFLEKKLKLTKDYTLKRLKEKTFTDIKYSVGYYNCIHFAQEVMEKLKQKCTLFNPGEGYQFLSLIFIILD